MNKHRDYFALIMLDVNLFIKLFYINFKLEHFKGSLPVFSLTNRLPDTNSTRSRWTKRTIIFFHTNIFRLICFHMCYLEFNDSYS